MPLTIVRSLHRQYANVQLSKKKRRDHDWAHESEKITFYVKLTGLIIHVKIQQLLM
jgi:hypothetical protein